MPKRLPLVEGARSSGSNEEEKKKSAPTDAQPKLEKDLEQGVRSSEGALALFELRIKALIGFDPNNFFY